MSGASGTSMIGHRCEGRFGDGEAWYPGIIADFDGDGYTIHYDDGDVEAEVPPERIRLAPVRPLGETGGAPGSPRRSPSRGSASQRLHLMDAFLGKKRLEGGLRVVVAGFSQFIIDDPANIQTEEQLLLKICAVINKGCPVDRPLLSPKGCVIQLHTDPKEINEPAYKIIPEVMDFGDGRAKHSMLKGGKVRVVKKTETESIPIEMRGVPVRVLEEFYADFSGKTSRSLLSELLIKCPNNMSYVEWVQGDHSGAPDFFISYSWDLDWRYIIAMLKAKIGEEAMIWVDILCCRQHQLQEGDMSEIKLMPELVNFAGQVLLLPGSLSRLWCNVEAAWSCEVNECAAYSHKPGEEFNELNVLTKGGGMRVGDRTEIFSASVGWRGCVVVAKNRGAVKIHFSGNDESQDEWVQNDSDRFKDDQLMQSIEAMCTQDRVAITSAATEILEKAAWHRPADAEYLQGMLANSLGGPAGVVRKLKRHLKPQIAADAEVVVESDVDVLRDVYEYTGGGRTWKASTNWLSAVLMESPLSGWYGVRTNPLGNVVSLNLASNGLTGKIPDSIAELGSIRTLFLQHNSLRGYVPMSMIHLRGRGCMINLAGNHDLQLSDMAPLGDTITLLDFSHLSLVPGVIPWSDFLAMENLEILRLNGNIFSQCQIPEGLDQLEKLCELQLDSLNLCGVLPCSLIRMKASGRCHVSLNNIRNGLSLPDDLGALGDDILRLDLSGCSLIGPIPDSIGRLHSIMSINFSDNNLVGEVPYSLKDCHTLQELQLDGNQLRPPKNAQLDDNGQMAFYMEEDVQAFFVALEFEAAKNPPDTVPKKSRVW